MLDTLKTLCELPGVSGREEAVRDFLLSKLDGVARCRVDGLGNLIVEKQGRCRAKKKVMVSAHMDEVGFVVTHVEENGLLRFSTVGGIDPRVLFGRRVLIGEQKVPGVVAGAPVHLLDSEERAKAPDLDQALFRHRRRYPGRGPAPGRDPGLCRVGHGVFPVWGPGASRQKPWTTERAARCFWRCSRRTFPMT